MMATNPGRAWAHTPSQDPGSGPGSRTHLHPCTCTCSARTGPKVPISPTERIKASCARSRIPGSGSPIPANTWPCSGAGPAAIRVWLGELASGVGAPLRACPHRGRAARARTAAAVGLGNHGRWEWHSGGVPFAFEQAERYSARRKQDRFDRALLLTYLSALGIPFEGDACGEAILHQEQVT
jgi:hypothetical protein